MALPACPVALPAELEVLVAEFGRGWAASDIRPRPSREVAAAWDDLVLEWSNAADLPLLVRKSNQDRGCEYSHASGRHYISTDNSVAHWSFTLACSGVVPSIAEIRSWVENDSIPIVMIQHAVEKQKAKYHRSLRPEFNVNTSGWKLGHIQPVGLKTRYPVANLPLEKIQQQHRALLAPSNMFVVPLAWSGLAECEAVIRAVASSARDAEHTLDECTSPVFTGASDRDSRLAT